MWTEERAKQLKAWMSQGFTSGQVEKAFEGLFTRRAIGAKAQRMGFKWLGLSASAKAKAAKAAKPVKTAKPKSVKTGASPKAADKSEARTSQHYTPLTLMERGWDSCAYIVGSRDGEALYCSAPKYEGGAAKHQFCRSHWARCYNPLPARQPRKRVA